MSGFVYYDPHVAAILVPLWGEQASQLRTAAGGLSSTGTNGLPPIAQGPAAAFLDNWASIERTASVAADVYADELNSTHGTYMSFDEEIARRMEDLEQR